ncbi:MAG TPA: DMT family transporter [Hyphomicrobiaceae bacterium]|nr:DMT family transporter [Hyphomicrobiaceae bacterium]
MTATKSPAPGIIESGLAVGVLCGVGAALFWAAGFVAIPRGLAAGLSPADIAFHRFVWTGLVLLPIVLRDGLGDLGGVGWGRGLVVFLLAGPFQAIISYSGFIFAPLAHGGVIHPGSAAMFGFVLAALVLKEPLTLRHFAGTLIIVAGLAVFAGESIFAIGGHALGGDLLFMTAGLMWALFGMLVKLWRLDSARATRASCFFALLIFAPLHGLLYGYGNMLSASLTENLIQVAVQGVLAGALAMYLYSRAVVILGAGRAAIFPSLVPGLTLLIAFVTLGVVPTWAQLAGLAVVMLGFWLALRR